MGSLLQVTREEHRLDEGAVESPLARREEPGDGGCFGLFGLLRAPVGGETGEFCLVVGLAGGDGSRERLVSGVGEFSLVRVGGAGGAAAGPFLLAASLELGFGLLRGGGG